MFRISVIALALAGCNALFGIPNSGEVIEGMPPDGPLPPGTNCEAQPGACSLLAATRELGAENDTLVLEGTFGDSVMVRFPGGDDGILVAASMVGTHRALVTIPVNATTGTLAMVTAGREFPSLVRFRGTGRGGAAIAHFQTEYHQTTSAMRSPRLTSQRRFATAVAVKNHVYVIGGQAQNNPVSSIDVGLINADGTLAGYTPSTVTLQVPRSQHASVVAGSTVYAIGGDGDALTKVERARINDNGSLTAFSAASDLVVGRRGAAAIVIGDGLFVIGGFDAQGAALDSIERMPLGVDGSPVGPFALVTSKLGTRRGGHAVAVLGGRLFAIGGASQAESTVLGSIERADITSDGELGAFVAAAATLATPRAAHNVVLLGRDLHVLGGVGADASVLTTECLRIDEDGELTPILENRRDLTRQRAGAALVVVDDNIHLVGGFTGASNAADSEMASTKAGDLADSTDALVAAPARPNGAGVTVVGDGAYWLGGETTGGGNIAIDRAVLDIAGGLGNFTRDTISLGIARRDPMVAQINTSVYVLGGFDNSTTLGTIENAQIVDDKLVAPMPFTPALPRARSNAGAAMFRDSLYLLGGRENAAATTTIDRMELVNERLAVGGPASDLAGPRQGACTVVIRDHIYQLGGLNANNTASGSIDDCTVNADKSLQCESGGSLVNPRAFARCAVIGNFLYVLGGNTDAGGGANIEVAEIDPSLGTLTTFGTQGGALATARQNPAVISAGNNLFVVGGETLAGVAITTSERKGTR